MTSKGTRTSSIKPQQAIEEYLSALLNPAAKSAATQAKADLAPALAPRPVAEARPVENVREQELSDREKEALQRTLLSSLRVEPEPVPEPPRAPLQPAKAPPESPKAQPETIVRTPEPKVAVKKMATPAVDLSTPQALADSVSTHPADVGGWLENGRPEWAQGRFECLLFGVAGLKLAVPLICLGGIHPVSDQDDLTSLPGMPDWFLGLMPTPQGNLRVVDSARWVMPECNVQNYSEKMRFVIRISGSDWGLACDDVDKSFTLMPDDVRWRTARSKRPWLAGTVIEHMCALMDVDAFNRLLKESERRNRYRK